eukprot:CAMPEP_0115741768 /NCGR_PEP_ID=MMETSP0272-20121206/90177_1 /TAXON_ID=71861 /ORGANISM="Scrippsiella trochoidea, Strain CCMP3099" /LENGTH=194 /DNA_ID=CAMNT_0003186459 /DNA_START=127 /DNA_END=708 /DNA_ORIENTATION=+
MAVTGRLPWNSQPFLLSAPGGVVQVEVRAGDDVAEVEEQDASQVGPPKPSRSSEQRIVHGSCQGLEVEEARRDKLHVSASQPHLRGAHAVQPMTEEDEAEQPTNTRQHAEPIAELRKTGLGIHEEFLQCAEVEDERHARHNEDPIQHDLLHAERDYLASSVNGKPSAFPTSESDKLSLPLSSLKSESDMAAAVG